MIAGITAFLIAVIWLYPHRFIDLDVPNHKTNKLSNLEILIKYRTKAQMANQSPKEMHVKRWQTKLEKIEELNQLTGLAVTPLIDYIITCERDEQTLMREFKNRSSAATGASITLMFMPILMWAIGFAIGVNVLDFLTSLFGLMLIFSGVALTIFSRTIIKYLSSSALKIPKAKSFKHQNSTKVAAVIFGTIFIYQTTYPGFCLATVCALIAHHYWHNLPLANNSLQTFQVRNHQHFNLEIIASLVEIGLPWPKVLSLIDDDELQAVSRRIEMGVSADLAFSNSRNWKSVGFLISESIKNGTKLADKLRLLGVEYREQCLSFRIQRVEKIAGRLIIPVNLFQLPAFLLVGLAPIVGSLIMQTFESFHI